MTEKIKGSDKPWLKSYKLGPYPLKKTLAPYPIMPMHKFLDDSAAHTPDRLLLSTWEEE